MRDYIVDASVVAKWLLPEADHERAKMLIDAPFHLRAPDLITPELLSVLIKRIVRLQMTVQQCNEMLQRFLNEYLDTRVRLIPSRLVAKNAFQIANKEKRSVYDSLYIALAVQAHCQLITADERLVAGIKDRRLKQHLIFLNDPSLELNP